MQIVIDISDETYVATCTENMLPPDVKNVVEAIKHGTPIPDNTTNLVLDTPNTCGDCPFCIITAEEKKYIGYCNTSDEDYYCKVLDRFMEYDMVDGGLDILGKPVDCPLHAESEEQHEVS